MIAAFAIVVLMTAAATGGGTVVLRLLGAWDSSPLPERTVFSFAIGVGIIGWAGFFLSLGSMLNTATLFGLLFVMTPGLLFLRREVFSFNRPEGWGLVLLTMLGTVLFFNFLGGMSPPADADSMAYHFALPKLFLERGELVFVPRAVDGAIPLLLQMTYMVALATGGEQALTFWTMVTGWGATAVVYCTARRYLDTNWSLMTALIFITTPAIIYGAGTGQAEIRNAMFVVVAAAAGAEALRTGLLRYAAVAGLAAGFFVASKYTGLVFAGVIGLMLLAQQRRFTMGAVYALAVLVAGSQWYAWNWWNTGDPVFPMLYGIVEYGDDVPWNAAQAAYFSGMFGTVEKAVPANILWLFLYPFVATLSSYPQFESLRTGLGPYALLVFPIALAGAWAHRARLPRSPLFLFALVAFAAYALWFLFGTSQRIRHFVPLYPLLLIPLTVAVHRGVEKYPFLFWPTAIACAAVLMIQMGGQVLFTTNHARYVFTGESRDAFLSRNIPGFEAAQWINKNLTGKDRVMISERTLIYLVDVPLFYAHTLDQAVIEIRPDSRDPEILWRQLRHEGVTHILSPSPTGNNGHYAPLISRGCLKSIKQFQIKIFASRTLPSLNAGTVDWVLYRLKNNECGLNLG